MSFSKKLLFKNIFSIVVVVCECLLFLVGFFVVVLWFLFDLLLYIVFQRFLYFILLIECPVYWQFFVVTATATGYLLLGVFILLSWLFFVVVMRGREVVVVFVFCNIEITIKMLNCIVDILCWQSQFFFYIFVLLNLFTV